MELKDYLKFEEPSEMEECRAYWKWAQHHPVLRDYLYHIVNEGRRNQRHGRNLKLIGLRAGLPDYHLPVPNKTWNGFWLEMKVRKKITCAMPVAQQQWLEKLRKMNQYATFAYGWEDAAEKTLSYLNDKV